MIIKLACASCYRYVTVKFVVGGKVDANTCHRLRRLSHHVLRNAVATCWAANCERGSCAAPRKSEGNHAPWETSATVVCPGFLSSPPELAPQQTPHDGHVDSFFVSYDLFFVAYYFVPRPNKAEGPFPQRHVKLRSPRRQTAGGDGEALPRIPVTPTIPRSPGTSPATHAEVGEPPGPP